MSISPKRSEIFLPVVSTSITFFCISSQAFLELLRRRNTHPAG